MTQPLTNTYTDKNGNTYSLEYFESDSFEHLPFEDCTQCYGIAWLDDKFIVVNNITKPGSWTPVGGSIEPGEHPDEALVREIKEESNMKVLSFKPIGYQKTTDITHNTKPFYQLRYTCEVEPYGPFESDPAGKVTEIKFVGVDEYKQYFDWGEIGDAIVRRAVGLRNL